ncbi:MAG: hypothetical protein Q9174_000820 [Haloplaca sp. 1 TL-2023]
MHTSICLGLAASSLYLGNSLAAPVALPFNAQSNGVAQSNQYPPTSFSGQDASVTTTEPLSRRAERKSTFDAINDLAFPPTVRSNPRSSPSPTIKDEDPAPEQQKRQQSFGVLHDLVLPQMISSPSSTPTPTTPAPANGAIPNSGSITFDR